MPALHIGDLSAAVPVVQGGMGVGISLSNLAAAVANEGGIGVISATGIGMLEPDFNNNFQEANKRALKREIAKARRMTGGIIGVNILAALTDYAELLEVAVEQGADAVFIGAGLPLRIPESLLGDGAGKVRTKFVPIVSSARTARVIFQYWQKHFGRLPDGVVVEGPLAGGHLGYAKDQIDNPDYRLEKILPEVISVVKPYEQNSGVGIPVIAAGGIFTGADIYKFMQMGAKGVQMATRFVATHECDASIEFKEAYIKCKKEDIIIIDSPVGLPGRAIQNEFLADVSLGKKMPYECGWQCLKTCDFQSSTYCICSALTNAKNGNLGKGFAFAGANAYRLDSIISVKELFNALSTGYEQAAIAEAFSLV
jgi:NAD(P)H-dependent flavin oxidoreductase YrpB (nitropropane dioxygenase family)